RALRHVADRRPAGGPLSRTRGAGSCHANRGVRQGRETIPAVTRSSPGRATAVLAALVAGGSAARAADRWTEFRGPSGPGHSDSVGLPREWSETRNVAWKTRVHGRGWSSPVVLGKQVWFTTATPEGKELFAVALDREDGRVVFDVKVFDVPRPEDTRSYNSYASPTPVIEDGRVYVHFGSYGTACLATDTGKVL